VGRKGSFGSRSVHHCFELEWPTCLGITDSAESSNLGYCITDEANSRMPERVGDRAGFGSPVR